MIPRLKEQYYKSLDGDLSKKFQIEWIEGNVGFPHLMNIVKQEWKQGKINYGIFEESNGFTIAGNPSIETSIKSHTLEKDGILAAALLIEIIAYAKSQNSTVLRLLDGLYLDHEIGYFVTIRSQIPEKGMFEGNLEEGELEIGQVSAQIDEIKTVDEIMEELTKGFKRAKNNLNKFDF